MSVSKIGEFFNEDLIGHIGFDVLTISVGSLISIFTTLPLNVLEKLSLYKLGNLQRTSSLWTIIKSELTKDKKLVRT